MYTTNVLEPMRADEKQLGGVKRRYQVALKASRTSAT